MHTYQTAVMNLKYTTAAAIARGDTGSVESYLAPATVERIDVDPECLCFVIDGTSLKLRIAGEAVREYPVCESFVETLLRRHHLNQWQLRHASNETAVSFFNDLLLAINEALVRVCVEDGEATTITSLRSTEFFA